MIRQAEVIVGTEIDDGVRFAVIGDGGARIRGGEQLRLVEFDRPCPGLHPFRETGRCL